jgi:hypothetical protein
MPTAPLPTSSLRTLVVSLLFLSTFNTSAQDKSTMKFGKISVEDFKPKIYSVDSNAHAIILADIGASTYQTGHKDGSLSLLFTRFTRIHILNKKGYDVANGAILLYNTDRNREEVETLKASTYQVDNGQIVETKMKKDAVFEEKYDRNHRYTKFTLPNLSEGCILEIQYTIQSDFSVSLPEWIFQHEQYPTLYSEFTAEIPEFYSFAFLSQGFHPLHSYTTQIAAKNYKFSFGHTSADVVEKVNYNASVTYHQWVRKNVPALKVEKYITSVNNYLTKINFQLSSVHFRGELSYDYTNSWPKLTEELMNSESFGVDINRNNHWLSNALQPTLATTTDQLEKAKKIFAYVKANFICTDRTGLFISKPLKEVFKSKVGNVADINLLLVAMLRHEALNCDPVILSTRNHGYSSAIYPVVDKFNYTACCLRINNTEYFLDASNPNIAFGKLPLRCYNGHCRIMNLKNPSPRYFDADSIVEKKYVIIVGGVDEKEGLTATIKSTAGYYESLNIREFISEKGAVAFKQTVLEKAPLDAQISNFMIDSLKVSDKPLEYSYSIKMPNATNDILYINPLFGHGYNQNPFTSANRQYPVEMPYTMDELFVSSINLPEGYEVDEMPTSSKVTYNDTEGFFEYLVQKQEDFIQVRSRIKLNKANFLPEEYNALRDFFGHIFKKHSETIVLKKKK